MARCNAASGAIQRGNGHAERCSSSDPKLRRRGGCGESSLAPGGRLRGYQVNQTRTGNQADGGQR